MAAGRVLFYVQHLLGIGHLRRAAALVNAMTQAGLEVTLVSGGVPVPGLRFNVAHQVQLPPASAADLSFKVLLDAQGQPVDEAWRQERRERLMAAWRGADPQVIVVELFPFGRRQMRFELVPMLDAARAQAHPPVVVSSVRDVLGGGQSDPARQDQMLDGFERHFDHVMVHGDPALVPFGRTFRHAEHLGRRLHYTGYVVETGEAACAPDMPGDGEVIVSVGGGAVGQRLLRTALQARPLCRLRDARWRLLAGVNASDSDLEGLRLACGMDQGVVVERYRSDFAQLLTRCRLSISQGGYNTVMEVLQAHASAVIVPFAGGSEIEQTLRTRLLAERGWVVMVEESELTPHNLAHAIDRASDRTSLPPAIRMDGARESAALVAKWAMESGAHRNAPQRPHPASAAWGALHEEIGRWRDAGRSVNFWWRDDDANQPGVPLKRLLALSSSTATPLALAVVPQGVHAGLLDGAGALVSVLQHGVNHRNAASMGEKKTEFPRAQPVAEALESLGMAWMRLEQAFPQRCLRVLVPPWNRVSCEGLVDRLSDSGYAGMSRFGARSPVPASAATGRTLVEVNTHVDVIDWKGSRGFAGTEAVLAQAVRHLRARRLGQADGAEATGWLTHHLVHDAATWAFMDQLFAFTARQPGVVWQSASALFAGH